ncbi:MAG TPA: response regulator [Sandaracinaceae bacterium LLY-WYZ-13_1]|nr:response regulator [Sandaracinaceae bacterium LLY-WYZ-13_1]
MSGGRVALLERFRSKARERVAALADAVSGGARPEPAVRDERLGALHTLKGEARMLGLASIAALAHGIEDRLHADDEAWRAPEVLRALDALDVLLLDRLEESRFARTTGRDALAALGAELAPAGAEDRADDGDDAGADGGGRADDGPRERLVEVRTSHLDAVADGLEELRMAMARIVVDRAAGAVDPDRLEGILREVERLADRASELRLAPVAPTFARLEAHARQLAAARGKTLRVEVAAGEVELERAVLDALEEPLLHLVRNAVDHGVSAGRPGRLRLGAEARGDGAELTVADDGAGLDPDALRAAAVRRGILDAPAADALRDEDALDLVFRAGLSTRRTADEVSGRGLGLDVVRRVAESLGGAAQVSRPTEGGTRFTLAVPVALARERVLVVPAGAILLGLPARLVVSVIELADGGADVVRVDGEALPLRSFAQLVGVPRAPTEPKAAVVELGDRRWALGLASIVGERDALRRPADRPLAALGAVSASSVLEDGRPVLFPALAELLRRAGARGVSRPRAAPRPALRARRVLVVDDSPIVRELLAELLGAEGFAVTEAEDGRAALERLDERAFELVVSDLEMPRMDGFELVRSVRERGLETPVIVVTTRGSAEDRRRAAECGADAYVVKTDFSEGDLLETVRRLAGEGAR